jgi:fibronectin-binding autotransporter adhesin
MKNIKFNTPRKTAQIKPIHVRLLLNSITALVFSGLALPSASAETYTITNSTTAPLDWNTAANWTPFTEAQYPGTAADDTAVVRGAFNGNVTVDLSATPANPLTGLTLGDTAGTGTTTIQSTNASNLALNEATITSAGASDASNRISAPILLTGGLTFGSATNDITVSGKITPSAAVNRTITNASARTVTLGDMDISTGDKTNIVLTLTNTTNPASKLILNGTIANGGTVSAGLTLGSTVSKTPNTTYQINGTNTHTGTTTLLTCSDQAIIYYLNSDQPFGTGPLNVATGVNAVTNFEALNTDRTIANATVNLQRATAYKGEKSILFKGTVTGGSSQSIVNNITGAGRLVFKGRYNTTSSTTDDARIISFNGTGTTVFNDIVADAPIQKPEQFGAINVMGGGTVIINGTATIQGDFRIAAVGTVQLGDGGTTGVITPANSRASVVTGGTTGTGFLTVNHSDPITLSSTLNGGIGLKQIGTGDLTVATPQFNTGANVVGDGTNLSKLVVTAGAVNETTQTGDIAAPTTKGPGYNVFRQIITGIDTTSLTVGQPVYLESAPGTAFYIHTIDGATQVSIWGTGVTKPTTGLPVGTGTAIKFGAGSSLGTNSATTTVKNNATLAGSGTISGAVTGEAGSRFAPGVNTLDADGGKRVNFGAPGTLTTGSLTLAPGSGLDFDLADTATGASDRIVTSNGNLSFNSLSVTFNGLTAGMLQTTAPYHLINAGTGSISGETSNIATLFAQNLAGRYTATYSVNLIDGVNYLDVTFAATSAPTQPEVKPEHPKPRLTPSIKRKWNVKS